MAVLITGASGRIGSEVVREFCTNGYEVRALDTRPIPKELLDLGAKPVYADITNLLDMLNIIQGCEGLVHLAALPGPYGPSANVFDINIKGTFNVLEAARSASINHTVITSSVGALGYSNPRNRILPHYLPIDIDHPPQLEDIYGLSKLTNEATAGMFARAYGMSITVLRPPMVIHLDHAKERGWLRRGPSMNALEFKSDFWGYIDVRDQARAFRLAYEAKLGPGAHIFFTMADDVWSVDPAQVLIERHLPTLIEYAPRVGKTLYDLQPAKDQLGFTAKIFWRDVLGEDPIG